MNFLILIPTLAFVALHFAGVPPIRGGTWKAIAVWVGLLIGAAMVLSHRPAFSFYPGNEVLRLVAKEDFRLHRTSLKKDDIVLLIEGSSAVTCCVDGAELERELQKKGLSVRVVQLSAGGSNHFERLSMLREWFDGLSAKDAKHLKNARVVLLNEVLYLYDFNPLQGFAENAFSDRSIAYTTSQNVLPMLEAALEKMDSVHPAPSPVLIPLIAAHYLFNLFRVGTFPLVAPPRTVYSANGPGSLAAALQPGGSGNPAPQSLRGTIASAPVDLRHLPFPWWKIYDRELRRMAAGPIDQIGYLILPTRDPFLRKYQLKFAETLGKQTLVVDSGTDATLRRLANRVYWTDDVHLRPDGAAIFTRLLADQIAANWPVISGVGPKPR